MTCNSVPREAAKINTLRMDFASADALRSKRTSLRVERKAVAARTSFAAARACKPRRLTMVTCHSTNGGSLQHSFKPASALATAAREQLAREVDALPPLVAHEARDLFERHARLQARELDDHRQVDARHHLDRALLQEHRGDVGGRPPEHVGHHEHAAALVDALDGAAD